MRKSERNIGGKVGSNEGNFLFVVVRRVGRRINFRGTGRPEES